MNFKIGEKIVCVESIINNDFFDILKGETYTIMCVKSLTDICFIALKEKINAHYYNTECFVKISEYRKLKIEKLGLLNG